MFLVLRFPSHCRVGALVFCAAGVLFAGKLQAETPEHWPEPFTALIVEPRSRAWVSLANEDLNEPRLFTRTRTAEGGLEYAFNENLSLFGALPYTKRWDTNMMTRSHIDMIPVGVRGMWTEDDWLVAGGVTARFASGNERLNIGDRHVGDLEAYVAPGVRVGALSGLFQVRYNTESTSSFREEANRPFKRTWLVDFVMGVDLGSVHPVLELERKMRYDPHSARLNTTVLTPGVNVTLGGVLLGVGVPYTVSKEREFDAGLILRATLFY
ncbi:MAG: hypothetical protein HY042_09655 [Spirochaetia bacterium]|nr:hypothetical protein [Spirochaetia bacterium]